MEGSWSRGARWLAPILATSFLGTAAFRASVPVVAYYTRVELQASLTLLSLLTVAFFLTRAAAAPVAGSLTDRSSRFYLLAPPLLGLNSLLILSYAYAESWGQLLLIRAGQGAVNGATWALLQVAVASHTPQRWRGTALATYFAMGSAGIFAGNAIYAALAPLGDRLVLAVAAALSAASAPIAYPPLRGLKRAVRARILGRGSETMRALPLLLTCFLAAFVGSVIMGDPIYVYLNEFVGFPREVAALGLGLTGALGVLASIPLGALADRRSERTAAAIALGFLSATPILLAPSAPATALTALLSAAIGWKGFTPISRRWAASHFKTSGVIVGLTNTAMNAGTILGVSAFGWAYDLLHRSTLQLGGLELSAAPLLIAVAVPALAASTASMLKASEQGELPRNLVDKF